MDNKIIEVKKNPDRLIPNGITSTKELINIINFKNYIIDKQTRIIENYDSIQADKCCECEHRAIQKYTDYALLINDICELLNCEENEIIDKIKNILTNS